MVEHVVVRNHLASMACPVRPSLLMPNHVINRRFAAIDKLTVTATALLLSSSVALRNERIFIVPDGIVNIRIVRHFGHRRKLLSGALFADADGADADSDAVDRQTPSSLCFASAETATSDEFTQFGPHLHVIMSQRICDLTQPHLFPLQPPSLHEH
jgi:hypothetical protein